MKCTGIRLENKKNQDEKKKKIRNENKTLSLFVAKETHSYSFPFIRSRSGKFDSTQRGIAITNITLPENKSFNTGSSLEKWSKKRPRLKSGKSPQPSVEEDDKHFCYETLETDFSVLLNDLDGGFIEHSSRDGSLSNLQYEVHTDIENLLLKTEKSRCEEVKERPKTNRKTKKHRKKVKTIKFSKPPSPRTEQIIRVDVTSNVSVEEVRRGDESDRSMAQDGVIDDNRKELKRNLNEDGGGRCDDEFIVRCRQLALRQRRL